MSEVSKAELYKAFDQSVDYAQSAGRILPEHNTEAAHTETFESIYGDECRINEFTSLASVYGCMMPKLIGYVAWATEGRRLTYSGAAPVTDESRPAREDLVEELAGLCDKLFDAARLEWNAAVDEYIGVKEVADA